MIGGPRLGTWYDHENGEGGDTWDFVQIKGRVASADVPEWVRDELGIDLRSPGAQHVVRTFDYRNEAGEILFQVRKWGPQKRFSQHPPDGRGGWKSGKGAMAGTRLVPYRLPELLAARAAANGTPPRAFLPEGEKDADALCRWNLTASCNPMGALKWKPEFNQHFAGFDLVILPDNDTVGERHGEQVAAQLAPIAASVRILKLHGLPEGGDVSDWISNGGTQSDLEDLIDDTPLYEPDDPPQRRFRFPLVRFADIALTTATRCIVEDLIPRESLVVCWGPPKCGKSFWIFDLVMHVARGCEYRGKTVEQGTVVYIAAEGELGIKARAHAYRQARMAETGEDPPFYLLTTRLDLVEDIDELIADIKAQLPDEQCLIIVIDTLNRTIHGSESKDDDMGAFRDAADRLRVEFRAAVIIIHHCGIDGTRPRGHTGLTGACDAQLAVKKDVDNSILVTLELMKDGPEGDMMRGRLEVVDVGIDDNGKPITSCVVEHLDAPTTAERRSQRKLSAAQQRALTLLHDAVNSAGEVPPGSNHIPPGKVCVSPERWRNYCYQGGISTGSEDAKRMAFNRAAEGLINIGRVGKWGEWVWPA